VSSAQMFPEVLDSAVLQPRLASNIYLPAGVEGMCDVAGDGNVGTLYIINRVDEASTHFGATSSLYAIVKALLDRGAGPVYAIPSKKGTTPALADRQAAWQVLESNTIVRLRLTDSEIQADLSGLAGSASNAALINNKQIAVVGMPSGTSKANLISAADAIISGAGPDASKRTVLIGPGVYDASGSLRGGSFSAAAAAAEIAKNSDPSNDLDLWAIQLATGIEQDAAGNPVFRRKVVTGVAVNDFEDLLRGGVSPLMPDRAGSGVQTSHLRMVYKADTTFDSLATRIIIDQVFIDVRDFVYDSNFLRMGNTATTRAKIKAGVEAVLAERNDWIQGVTQADGTTGYNVSVTPSNDQRQVIIGYQGVVVRGIQTVLVAPTLAIPV
jgi:hypothetical protein